MTRLPHRASQLTFVLLILGGGRAFGQTQTPGQITKFDQSQNVVDSVITEDPNGNIGIGTTVPAAALDVASGDLNLSSSILKGGQLFIHNLGGVQNTFIGITAGNPTTSGDSNTGVGYQAFESNTTGYSNTAVGAEAMESNTDGSYNTAIGFRALQTGASGNQDTAVGSLALQNSTFGFAETAIGYAALGSDVVGEQNTAVGNAALFRNVNGSTNAAVGNFALFNNTSGLGNTAIGHNALTTNTTGENNTAVGTRAGVSAENFTNATAIGFAAVVDASNKIRLGNSQVTVIEGQVPYTFTSDRYQKENFRAVDGEALLRKLAGLSLTSWNYIGHDPQQFRHYGPVAQEFFAAFGHDAVGTIGTPITINSGDLDGILMIAVQTLEKQNAELRTRIEALERLVKGVTTGVQ